MLTRLAVQRILLLVALLPVIIALAWTLKSILGAHFRPRRGVH